MRELPCSEYELMEAFSQILVEGVVGLVESILGVADEALPDEIKNKGNVKESLSKIRNKVDKFVPSKSNKKESIVKDGNQAEEDAKFKAHRDEQLKAQIAGVAKSAVSEYRFREYERMGLLDQCLAQRAERLAGENKIK